MNLKQISIMLGFSFGTFFLFTISDNYPIPPSSGVFIGVIYGISWYCLVSSAESKKDGVN